MLAFKGYEGQHEFDTHIRITKNMLESASFKELSSDAKSLYIYMKLHAKGNYMVVFDMETVEGLYMNKEAYNEAINELLDKGFVNAVGESWNGDTPNHFKFSNQWYVI